MLGKGETLAAVWEIPDHLWEQIHPVILEMDPSKATGRKRADPRRMLDGIVFRLRSGCQWNRLPRELGDGSTMHRTFQRWVELGVLERVWAVLNQYQGGMCISGRLTTTERTPRHLISPLGPNWVGTGSAV